MNDMKQLIVLISCISLLFTIESFAQVKVDFAKKTGIPLFKKFQQYSAGSIPYKNFERDFDRLSEIDASSLRIDLSIGKDGISAFPDVVSGTPENLKYNFSVLDKLASNLIERNVQPVYSWSYIPLPFQQGSFRKLNPTITAWENKWYNMHKEFARHYRQRDLPIYHEIYNEPDHPEFLDPGTFETYYNKMFVSAALGLKAGDPEAVIGAPASACGPCTQTRNVILLAKQNKINLDFFSFHSYGSNFSSFNTVAQWLYDEGFFTTDIYIDEFNWYVPWETGAGDADDSALNIYSAAGKTFDTFDQMLTKTRISMVHWAMFMNAGLNGIGMINWEGEKRAVFNAFKIFADMPIDRKEFVPGNVNLKGFASSDEHKMSVVVWNTSSSSQTFALELANPNLPSGTLEVYRIDSKNASLNNGATENLEIIESKELATTSGQIWTGQIPGGSVVYFTVKDQDANTFDYSYRENKIGNITQVLHYYPSYTNNNSNYAEFDTKTSTAYLGLASQLYPISQTSVKVYNLPESIDFSFETEGEIKYMNYNSFLGLRIDFQTEQGYVKSVLFHGPLYDEQRATDVPWGTKKAVDSVTEVDLANFNVKFADYAPENWNGKAVISYIMHDCGFNTKVIVRAKAIKPIQQQTILFDSIPNIQFDGPAFELHAKSSSGLPIKYEVVEGGNIVSIKENVATLSGKQGYVEVKAFQEGNGTYAYSSAFRRFLVSNPEIPLGNGTGLMASYWNGEGVVGTISGNEKFFVDSVCGNILWPTIDHIWYSEGPGCEIGPNYWSIRWTGFIQPLYTEEYTFYTTIDDGARVTIDGTMVINDYPGGHSMLTKSGKIKLEAGKKYPITIDFTQWWNNAAIKFEWESATQLREIVPSSQIYVPDLVNGINNSYLQREKVQVYPNPVNNGKITIEFQNQNFDELQFFELYSIEGKLVLSGSLKSIQTVIDISEVSSSGFWILRVVTSEGVSNHAIIIR
jgi:xylan 1,4-beta-xylosidase